MTAPAGVDLASSRRGLRPRPLDLPLTTAQHFLEAGAADVDLGAPRWSPHGGHGARLASRADGGLHLTRSDEDHAARFDFGASTHARDGSSATRSGDRVRLRPDPRDPSLAAGRGSRRGGSSPLRRSERPAARMDADSPHHTAPRARARARDTRVSTSAGSHLHHRRDGHRRRATQHTPHFDAVLDLQQCQPFAIAPRGKHRSGSVPADPSPRSLTKAVSRMESPEAGSQHRDFINALPFNLENPEAEFGFSRASAGRDRPPTTARHLETASRKPELTPGALASKGRSAIIRLRTEEATSAK